MENQPAIFNAGENLLRVVNTSLLTVEPHVGPQGYSSLFRGAYDWHSCVHAHWARLSICRILGIEAIHPSPEFLSEVLRETKLLNNQEHRKFEWPYGWAWYTLLLSEMARLYPATLEEINETKFKLFDELLAWIQLKQKEGNGRSSGRHSSWLFPLFLLCLVASDDDSLNAKVRLSLEWTEQFHTDNSENPHDFFHCPSIESLIKHLTSKEKTHLSVYPHLPANFPSAANQSHNFGLRITSAWPMAVSAAEGDTIASGSFDVWLNEFMSHRALWEESFDRLSHWIPQFIWMTIYLRLGRP